jgi:hypothetical protein
METRAPRLISMHPLARVTLYALLYWYVNQTAIDAIWRIAQP